MKLAKKLIISTALLGSVLLGGCGNTNEIKYIHTDNAPQAIGPYQQAAVIDGTVYCSGQIAIDPATNEFIGGDIETQTHRVMKNLKAVLEAAGSSFEKVTKTTIFIVDLGNFNKVNEVYASYFSEGHYPARSCVVVSELPKGAGVEIECVAVVSK